MLRFALLCVCMGTALAHTVMPNPAALQSAMNDDEMNVDENTMNSIMNKPSASGSDLMQQGQITRMANNFDEDIAAESVGFFHPTSDSLSPLPRVLFGVMSAPANAANRRAIRASWMRMLSQANAFVQLSPDDIANIEVKFFVGNSTADNAIEIEEIIANESADDIVRLHSLLESYHNLTLKTRMMVEYAADQDYDMLFKLDDDDFVRVDNFVRLLRAIPRRNYPLLYWGRIKHNVSVIRTPGHRWQEKLFNGSDHYPDYMLGSGYVLGRNVLRFLRERIDMLPLYSNEDASVGIWIQDLPVRRVAMAQMVLQPWCSEDVVLVNDVSPQEQLELMQNTEMGSMCASHSTKPFYPSACSDQPCRCCVDPKQNIYAQDSQACCY